MNVLENPVYYAFHPVQKTLCTIPQAPPFKCLNGRWIKTLVVVSVC